MSVLVIELNDAGIQARSEPDPLSRSEPSPGIAVFDGRSVLTGTDAERKARLLPKSVSSRFWCDLDTESLDPPFPPDISSADLAHAHLSEIWKATGPHAAVLLAVPGTFSERQLGLILGIARACEMPVKGLVDAAVAASRWTHCKGRILHLDLQLNRVVVTELTKNDIVRRESVRVTARTGLLSLQASWARRIARIFISMTRFDPLHVAQAEQELYSRIPSLLRRLCNHDRAAFDLGSSGRDHSVELGRQDIVEAVAADYEAIAELVSSSQGSGEPSALLLSHRAACLPGLADRLRRAIVMETVELEPEAAMTGSLGCLGEILSPDDDLPLITSLPASRVPTNGTPQV